MQQTNPPSLLIYIQVVIDRYSVLRLDRFISIKFFCSKIFQMSQEFFCQICAITCTGQAPFEEHLKSTKHIRKSQGSVVVPSSPSQPISRLQSSPRASNMAEDSPSSSSTVISSDTMRILLEWNHPRGYKPYCEICHVHLHGEGNADRHFQSTNSLHYNKLADWETIRNGGILYSCKVCSDIFNDSGQMHDHFTSTIHQTMVEQKDLLEKFIRIYQTYDKLKQVHRENQGKLKFENM